jgi:hypothetical protein
LSPNCFAIRNSVLGGIVFFYGRVLVFVADLVGVRDFDDVPDLDGVTEGVLDLDGVTEGVLDLDGVTEGVLDLDGVTEGVRV